MRAILQRVLKPATVSVDGVIEGKVEKGMVVFLGVEEVDTKEDIEWLSRKICQMRIFNDNEHKMNLSISDIEGDLLVISQFTLYASTKKGNRPSFLRSAKPEFAEKMYDDFINHVRAQYNLKVATGIFGADMKIDFINDGPITIILDSKNKE